MPKKAKKPKFKYVNIGGEVQIYLSLIVKVAEGEEIDEERAQELFEEMTPDDWFRINPARPDIDLNGIDDMYCEPSEGPDYIYKNGRFYHPNVFEEEEAAEKREKQELARLKAKYEGKTRNET